MDKEDVKKKLLGRRCKGCVFSLALHKPGGEHFDDITYLCCTLFGSKIIKDLNAINCTFFTEFKGAPNAKNY